MQLLFCCPKRNIERWNYNGRQPHGWDHIACGGVVFVMPVAGLGRCLQERFRFLFLKCLVLGVRILFSRILLGTRIHLASIQCLLEALNRFLLVLLHRFLIHVNILVEPAPRAGAHFGDALLDLRPQHVLLTPLLDEPEAHLQLHHLVAAHRGRSLLPLQPALRDRPSTGDLLGNILRWVRYTLDIVHFPDVYPPYLADGEKILREVQRILHVSRVVIDVH
mmetsp:Transcript_9250/g.22730  ORF Transcript_9250/g.22730 Transcript_9250/m.22730 type:complete len:221 (+) Transcript_9250:700-1362(+)